MIEISGDYQRPLEFLSAAHFRLKLNNQV